MYQIQAEPHSEPESMIFATASHDFFPLSVACGFPHPRQQTNACESAPALACPIDFSISLFEFIFNLFPFLIFSVIGYGIIHFQDHFCIRMTHPFPTGVYINSVISAESTERMTECIRYYIKINPCRQRSCFFFYALILCFSVPAFPTTVDCRFHTEYV